MDVWQARGYFNQLEKVRAEVRASLMSASVLVRIGDVEHFYPGNSNVPDPSFSAEDGTRDQIELDERRHDGV